MWKVMIADDEPKIRRGLRSTIERMRPDMQVVAEAEDGETALALVRKVKPDILMIDIRMPFLNGLELIEKINEIWRDCIIIVVTGHDEFEYAQRALHLRVFEYVLKPVPQEVLAAVLARAEGELSGARRQNKYIAWARQQLDRNMPLLREQFLRNLVKGRLSGFEIEEQAAFLGVRTGNALGMVIVHVAERSLPPAASGGERDRHLALLAVRSLVEETLQDFSPLWVFPDEQEDIVAIACTTGGQEWVDAIGRIRSGITESVAVAHATVPDALSGIPEIYESLAAEIVGTSSHRAFVALAQSYIDAHYGEPELSLEQVAGAVEVSPGYLSRLLKHETGFSFVDYLTRVRINKAVQIMSDPAVKVYEVAEAVGYQSQHYFSRAFKRVFGRPPVEYRKGGA
jgi:two-component system, response regulator YesN